MSIGQMPMICIVFLGAYLLSDVTESKCRCTKMINDYCCESADSPPGQKDACCHTKGFHLEPPTWNCELVPNAECKSDRDCIGIPCVGCECRAGPEPPLGPGDENPDVCPENSECSSDAGCHAKAGEICKCASCECTCERHDGQCDDSSACHTDADCRLNSNGTVIPERENFQCVDCACERTMSGDCGEGECRSNDDCMVEDPKFKGFCDTTSCQCFLEEMEANY